MKNTEPILLVDYAWLAMIDKEPAFNWWVSTILHKKNRVLSCVKEALWIISLKFGIIVPTSVKDALALDKANCNYFWEKSINKEMTSVKIAFKFLEKGINAPVGYKQIPYFIIFDVKMDLTHKA